MFSPITEKFTRDLKYPWYEGFNEERISYVDDDKNIVVHDSCINLAQEENSQYIPFEIERYYQGIDLTKMMLQIYFVNSEQKANYHTPVNVTYSDYYIRFGWLVDRNATYVSGNLTFEIRAIGTITDDNGKAYDYVWKTRPNSQISIEKSLYGQDIFTPTEDWYFSLVRVINEKSDNTKIYMDNAQASMQNAATSESNAKSSETNAKIYEDNAAGSATSSSLSAEASASSASDSSASATLSKSWAVGGTSTRVDEETNNAKYWCETAKDELADIKSDVSILNNNLSSESIRAQGAESVLTNNLNSEITRSKAAENLITDSLNSEIARSKSAEGNLESNINTINANLSAEISRAQSSESGLSTKFDAVNSNLSVEISRAQTAENELSGRITTNTTKLNTLIASDSDKSIRTIANEEIAAKLIKDNADISMDSLEEIASWISNHPGDAATMNASIASNTENIKKNSDSIADINSILNTKANASDVNTSLAAKANASDVNATVAQINTALSGKADNSSVNTLSASVTAVSNLVSSKVDVAKFDDMKRDVANLTMSMESKADKTYVDGLVANKSDSTHTHTFVHIGIIAPEDTSILWVDPVNGLKYYDGSSWQYVIFGSGEIDNPDSGDNSECGACQSSQACGACQATSQ